MVGYYDHFNNNLDIGTTDWARMAALFFLKEAVDEDELHIEKRKKIL